MNAVGRAWLLLSLGLASCGSPSADECQPGSYGCPCVVDVCHDGLACIAGMCMPGAGTSADASGGTSETADDGSDGADATVGSGSGMQDTGSGDGSDGGPVDCAEPATVEPADPPANCLPDVPCLDDANCPDGHVCNDALPEPACEQIFCGTEGSPCDSDGVCADGMTCHANRCNPCTFCGNLCEVDFATDPQHCGCCDNPVPGGGVCNGGVPGCPGTEVLCGSSCADLSSDAQNCGDCGVVVPDGHTCNGGAIGCAPGFGDCSGSCLDLQNSPLNCGACGAVCPPSYFGEIIRFFDNDCFGQDCGCHGGTCLAWLAAYERVTCDSVCEAQNLTCSATNRYYTCCSAYGGPETCGEIPPPLDPYYDSSAFVAVTCKCVG